MTPSTATARRGPGNEAHPVTDTGPDPRRARFEALFAVNHDPVLRYLVRRTASRDDAADLLAETFSPPGDGWTTYPPTSRPCPGCTAWLVAYWPTTGEGKAAAPASPTNCAATSRPRLRRRGWTPSSVPSRPPSSNCPTPTANSCPWWPGKASTPRNSPPHSAVRATRPVSACTEPGDGWNASSPPSHRPTRPPR